ncbi:MAG: hypothetical protein SOU50_02815 [Oscillospiraceae bacterium]|nr:hypothetical protein [Oscillospiraceae bacterium]
MLFGAVLAAGHRSLSVKAVYPPGEDILARNDKVLAVVPGVKGA